MIEAAQWAADRFAAGQPGNRAVRNTFLAWWAAEDGWGWPTNGRNNPGNLRPSGDGTGSVGVTGQGQYATWRPKNFYVYATPGDGVAMMVQRIQRSANYPGIRAAVAQVAAGSAGASAIARAVGKSPWGTNTPTMLAALVVANATGATPTGTGWATVHPLGRGAGGGGDIILAGFDLSSQTKQIILNAAAELGKQPTDLLTSADVERLLDLIDAATPGGLSGGIDLRASFRAGLTPYIGKPISALEAYVNSPGASPTGIPDAPAPLSDIAAAIAGIPAALGDVAVHVGWFLALVAVLVIGLYLLVESE